MLALPPRLSVMSSRRAQLLLARFDPKSRTSALGSRGVAPDAWSLPARAGAQLSSIVGAPSAPSLTYARNIGQSPNAGKPSVMLAARPRRSLRVLLDGLGRPDLHHQDTKTPRRTSAEPNAAIVQGAAGTLVLCA